VLSHFLRRLRNAGEEANDSTRTGLRRIVGNNLRLCDPFLGRHSVTAFARFLVFQYLAAAVSVSYSGVLIPQPMHITTNDAGPSGAPSRGLPRWEMTGVRAPQNGQGLRGFIFVSLRSCLPRAETNAYRSRV